MSLRLDGYNFQVEPKKKKKSDVGSQYRCGRVGRGIQPQSIPQVPYSNAQKASKTLVSSVHGPTKKKYMR